MAQSATLVNVSFILSPSKKVVNSFKLLYNRIVDDTLKKERILIWLKPLKTAITKILAALLI